MTRRSSARMVQVVAVAAVATLVAFGCSGDDGGSESASPAPGGAGTTVAATDVACDDGAIQQGEEGATIVGLVESTAEEQDLTSVLYRVTRDGEVLASGAVGDTMTGIPADTTMHFRN